MFYVCCLTTLLPIVIKADRLLVADRMLGGNKKWSASTTVGRSGGDRTPWGSLAKAFNTGLQHVGFLILVECI